MRDVFVLGHSHLTAVRRAWAERNDNTKSIEFCGVTADIFHPEVTNGRLHPLIQARLDAAPTNLYISMLGGNDHCKLSLVNDKRPYDLVLPDSPDLPLMAQAELIPAAALLAELLVRAVHYLDILAAFRAAAPGRIIHIESPPPIPSTEFIMANTDTFGTIIAQHGVAPALLRYKMWRLHSGLYKTVCAKLGIEFLPAPSSMQDENGMLVEAAWRDATHANDLYGQAVLAQLDL